MNPESAQNPEATRGSVALVSHHEALGFDYEMSLLPKAARNAGRGVDEVCWVVESIDWPMYDHIVIRGT